MTTQEQQTQQVDQENKATQQAQGAQPQQEQQGQQGIEREAASQAPVRRGSYGNSPFSANPFSLMRRFSEDMDRLFGSFFGGVSPFGQSQLDDTRETTFWPDVEVHHAGNKLVIRADVPGLKKADVNVEVRGNDICISGERKSESEQHEGQYYRSERSYGSFFRSVPLPEGAKPDTASATFENGVLKFEMEAGEDGGAQPRRIEVREGSPH